MLVIAEACNGWLREEATILRVPHKPAASSVPTVDSGADGRGGAGGAGGGLVA